MCWSQNKQQFFFSSDSQLVCYCNREGVYLLPGEDWILKCNLRLWKKVMLRWVQTARCRARIDLQGLFTLHLSYSWGLGLERIGWLATTRFWLPVRVLLSSRLRASLWCTNSSRSRTSPWLVWVVRLVPGSWARPHSNEPQPEPEHEHE